MFEKGASALKDAELLAILLRTGYEGKSALEIARRILTTKTLNKLAQLDLDELARIKGVGKSRAATIVAALEVSKRILADDKAVTIKTPDDVIKAVGFLRRKKREHLVALYLNARNELIKTHIVSVGTLTANLIHPREVFAPAIKNNASHIIIVHNHPSGDTEASPEDIAVTRKLIKAGEILGIKLADHIIITKNSHSSLKAEEIV